MGEKHSVLLVGGPDAGKTNFIIRLWLAIRDKRGQLQPDGLPNNVEYLEIGTEKLLSGEFSPHTSHEVKERLEIPVQNARGDHAFRGTLVVPDYSGEEWLKIYRRREWSEDWEELITKTCGCLLFIRVDSDQNVTPLDWITVTRLFGSPTESASSVNEGIAGEQDTPTQVILVEWLQFLRRAFTDKIGGAYRPRVGIVITAWDFVPTEQKDLGPETYLETNFPMLKDFIDTNSNRFDFGLFGVSIVAGDLKNQEYRTAYLRGNPRTAGYVTHSLNGVPEETDDLTIPVAWALGINASVGNKQRPVS